MSLVPKWMLDLLRDARLEYRIDAVRVRCSELLAKRDYPAARAEFAVLGLLCAQRRPEQVARLEQARGLRG